MVFCNIDNDIFEKICEMVTILILVDGFLQCDYADRKNKSDSIVTILILVDGFLQFGYVL